MSQMLGIEANGPEGAEGKSRSYGLWHPLGTSSCSSVGGGPRLPNDLTILAEG